MPRWPPDGEGTVFCWAVCVLVFDELSWDWLLQLVPPIPRLIPWDLLHGGRLALWGGLSSAVNIIILCPLSRGCQSLVCLPLGG